MEGGLHCKVLLLTLHWRLYESLDPDVLILIKIGLKSIKHHISTHNDFVGLYII